MSDDHDDPADAPWADAKILFILVVIAVAVLCLAVVGFLDIFDRMRGLHT